MAEYLWGTFLAQSGLTDFQFQTGNVSVESDMASIKDNRGEELSATRKHYNKRLKCDISGAVPTGASIPVNGSTVTLTGVTVSDTAISVGSGTLSATVEDVKITGKNDAYTEFSGTLYYKIPAATTTTTTTTTTGA